MRASFIFLAALFFVLSCPCHPARARMDAKAENPGDSDDGSGNYTVPGYPNLGPFLDKYYSLKSSAEDVIGDFQFNFRFTGYYQWRDYAKISDISYASNDGFGFVSDFWINWFPVEGGRFHVKFRYGQGRGGNRQMNQDGATLAYLNEISVDVPPNHLRVNNMYYTQHFLNGDFFVALGKADPEVFIDQNRYANDEYQQFMGQPFVADPVLDNEDTHAPMVAMGGSPFRNFTIHGYVGSTTWGGEKNLWDDPWEQPFVGLQAAYDTDVFGHNGTYRLVGYSATYQHAKLSGSGTAPGFGIGLNFDQQITDKVGIFGRAYRHNDVYNMPWAFSTGVAADGLIPKRDQDTLGLAVAALVADDVVHTGGVETHLEAYYRIALCQYVYLTPDISYIIQPKGESDNDNVLAAILRLQIQF